MDQQKPSIGRIVHYRSHGSPNGVHKSEPRAAIVTAVRNQLPDEQMPRVDLCIMNPTGLFFGQDVEYHPSEPGCWYWPPRV